MPNFAAKQCLLAVASCIITHAMAGVIENKVVSIDAGDKRLITESQMSKSQMNETIILFCKRAEPHCLQRTISTLRSNAGSTLGAAEWAFSEHLHFELKPSDSPGGRNAA